MATYIVKTSLSHGQGRGDERKVWDVRAGTIIDPAQMDMDQDTIDSLVAAGTIAVYEGGDAPRAEARPAAGARTASARQQEPDPMSSVGVRRELKPSGRPDAGTAAPGSAPTLVHAEGEPEPTGTVQTAPAPAPARSAPSAPAAATTVTRR